MSGSPPEVSMWASSEPAHGTSVITRFILIGFSLGAAIGPSSARIRRASATHSSLRNGYGMAVSFARRAGTTAGDRRPQASVPRPGGRARSTTRLAPSSGALRARFDRTGASSRRRPAWARPPPLAGRGRVRYGRCVAEGALAGVRVLELGLAIAAPQCCQVLADHGADVIKVEPPGGDKTRWALPHKDGESLYFDAHNRGKRSVI